MSPPRSPHTAPRYPADECNGRSVYNCHCFKNSFFYDSVWLQIHILQVKIAEYSKTPEDFLKKYEELKSKNVRNLDPLVYLLSKLTEDKEVTFCLSYTDNSVSLFCCNA